MKLISFGFKYEPPLDRFVLKPLDKVIDVRPLLPQNPHHVPRLRRLTGLNVAVQEWFWLDEHMPARLEQLKALIGLYPKGTVYLGCTGGRHRSVFAAEYFSHVYDCPVEHLDIRRV